MQEIIAKRLKFFLREIKRMVENLVKTYIPNSSKKATDGMPAEHQQDLIICLETSMKILGGTKEAAFEILELLCIGLPDDVLLLKSAYMKNDVDETRDLLHKIEGGLCYCGVPRLQKVVETLHHRVRNVESLSSLESLYNEFYEEAANVIKEFSRMK